MSTNAPPSGACTDFSRPLRLARNTIVGTAISEDSGRGASDQSREPLPGSVNPWDTLRVRGDVLVVDDDPAMCELTRTVLEENGLNVSTVTGVEAAQEQLTRKRFDVVLTDLRLGPASGLDLCRLAATAQPATPVVLFTAYGDMDAAISALRAGAADFIPKPDDVATLRDEVVSSIRALIERRDAEDTAPLSEDEAISLEEVERQHIQRVLELVGGNKRAAARLLKLDRSTLYRKLKRYETGQEAGSPPN